MARQSHGRNREPILMQWIHYLLEPRRFFTRVVPAAVIVALLVDAYQHPKDAQTFIGNVIGLVFVGWLLWFCFRKAYPKKKGDKKH